MNRRHLILSNQVGQALISLSNSNVSYQEIKNKEIIELFISSRQHQFLYLLNTGDLTFTYDPNACVAIKPQTDLYSQEDPLKQISFIRINDQLNQLVLQKDSFLPLNRVFGNYFRNEGVLLPKISDTQLQRIVEEDMNASHFVFFEELLYIQIQAMRQSLTFEQEIAPPQNTNQTEDQLISGDLPNSPESLLFQRFYKEQKYLYSSLSLKTIHYLYQQNGFIRFLTQLVIHEQQLKNISIFRSEILELLKSKNSLAVQQYEAALLCVQNRLKFVEKLITILKPLYPLLCRFINLSFSSPEAKYDVFTGNNQCVRKLSWQMAKILFDLIFKIQAFVRAGQNEVQQEIFDQQKITSFIIPSFSNELILAAKNYLGPDFQAIDDPRNYCIKIQYIMEYFSNLQKLTGLDVFMNYYNKSNNILFLFQQLLNYQNLMDVISEDFLPFSGQLKTDILNSVEELRSLCINKETSAFLTLVDNNILNVVQESPEQISYENYDNLLVPYLDIEIIDTHYHIAALFHLKCQIITEKLQDLEINITSHLLDGFQTIDSIVEFLQVFSKVSYLFTSKPIILQLSRVFNTFLIQTVRNFEIQPISINDLEYQQTQVCIIAKYINKLGIKLLKSMLQLDDLYSFIQVSKDSQFSALLTLSKLITNKFNNGILKEATFDNIKLNSLSPYLNWFIIKFDQYLEDSTEYKASLIRKQEDYFREKSIMFLEIINQSIFEIIDQETIQFINLYPLIKFLNELENFIIYSKQQDQIINQQQTGIFPLFPAVNCFIPDISLQLKSQVEKYNVIYNFKQLTFIYKSRLNSQIDNLYQVAQNSKFLTWSMDQSLKEFSNKSAFMLSNSLMSNQLFFEVIGECTEMLDDFFVENKISISNLELYQTYKDDFLQIIKDTIINNQAFLEFPVDSFDLQLQNYFKIGHFCFDQTIKIKPPLISKKTKNFRKAPSQMQNKELFRIVEHTILKCKNFLNEQICTIQNRIITSLSEINEDFYPQIIPDLQLLVDKITYQIQAVQILQLGIIYIFMSEKTYPLFQVEAIYEDTIKYIPEIVDPQLTIDFFQKILVNVNEPQEQALLGQDILHKLSSWLEILLDLSNYDSVINIGEFKAQNDINIFSSPFVRIILWINSIMSSHSYLNSFLIELQNQFDIKLTIKSDQYQTNLIIPYLYNKQNYAINNVQQSLLMYIQDIYQQIMQQVQVTENNILVIDQKILELKSIRYKMQDLFQKKSQIQSLLIEDYATIQNLITLYETIQDETLLKQFFQKYDICLNYLKQFQYEVNNIHLGFTILNSTKLLSYYQKVVYDIVQEAMAPVVQFIENILNDSNNQLQKQIQQLELVIQECTQQNNMEISNYTRIEKLIRSSFIMKCCIQTFILINQKCVDMNLFLTSSNVLIHTNIDQFQRELPLLKLKIEDINQRVEILINNTRIQFIYHTHKLVQSVNYEEEQFLCNLIQKSFVEAQFVSKYILFTPTICEEIISLIQQIQTEQLDLFQKQLLHIYELRYLQGQCPAYGNDVEYFSFANINIFVADQLKQSSFIQLQETVQYKIQAYTEILQFLEKFDHLIKNPIDEFYNKFNDFLFTARNSYDKIYSLAQSTQNLEIRKQIYECTIIINSCKQYINIFQQYQLFQQHHWIKVLTQIKNTDISYSNKVNDCILLLSKGQQPLIQQLMLLEINLVLNIEEIIQNAFEEDLFNKTIDTIQLNFDEIYQQDVQSILIEIIIYLSQYKNYILNVDNLDVIKSINSSFEQIIQKKIQLFYNELISTYKIDNFDNYNIQQIIISIERLEKLCVEHPFMEKIQLYRQLYFKYQKLISCYFLYATLICKMYYNCKIAAFLSFTTLDDAQNLDLQLIFSFQKNQQSNFKMIDVMRITNENNRNILQILIKENQTDIEEDINIIHLDSLFWRYCLGQISSDNIILDSQEISDISVISGNQTQQFSQSSSRDVSLVQALVLSIQLQNKILDNITNLIQCNLQVSESIKSTQYQYSLQLFLEKFENINFTNIYSILTSNSEIFPILEQDFMDSTFMIDFTNVFIPQNLTKSKYLRILNVLRIKSKIKKYFQLQQEEDQQQDNSLFVGFLYNLDFGKIYQNIPTLKFSSFETNTIIGFQLLSQSNCEKQSLQHFVPLYRQLATQNMPEIPSLVFPFSVNHPFLQIIVQLILQIEESIAIYTTLCVKKLRLMLHISTHADSYYSPNLQNDQEFQLELFQYSDQFNFPSTIYPPEIIKLAFQIVLDSSIVIPHEVYLKKEYVLQSSVQLGLILIEKLEKFCIQLQDFISGFLGAQVKQKSFTIALISEIPFYFQKAEILYNMSYLFLIKLKDILQEQQQGQSFKQGVNFNPNNYLYKQLNQQFLTIQHEINISQSDEYQFLALDLKQGIGANELTPEQLIILLDDKTYLRVSYIQQICKINLQSENQIQLPFISAFAIQLFTESTSMLNIEQQNVQKLIYLISKLSQQYCNNQFVNLKQNVNQIYQPKYKQVLSSKGDLLAINKFQVPKYDFLYIKYLDQISFLTMTQYKPQIFGGRSSIRSKTYTNNYTSTFISQTRNNVVTNDVFGMPIFEQIEFTQNSSYSLSYSFTDDNIDSCQQQKSHNYKVIIQSREQGWEQIQLQQNFSDQISPFYDEESDVLEDESCKYSIVIFDVLCVFVSLASYQFNSSDLEFEQDILKFEFLQQQWCQNIILYLQGNYQAEQNFVYKDQVLEILITLTKLSPFLRQNEFGMMNEKIMTVNQINQLLSSIFSDYSIVRYNIQIQKLAKYFYQPINRIILLTQQLKRFHLIQLNFHQLQMALQIANIYKNIIQQCVNQDIQLLIIDNIDGLKINIRQKFHIIVLNNVHNQQNLYNSVENILNQIQDDVRVVIFVNSIKQSQLYPLVSYSNNSIIFSLEQFIQFDIITHYQQWINEKDKEMDIELIYQLDIFQEKFKGEKLECKKNLYQNLLKTNYFHKYQKIIINNTIIDIYIDVILQIFYSIMDEQDIVIDNILDVQSCLLQNLFITFDSVLIQLHRKLRQRIIQVPHSFWLSLIVFLSYWQYKQIKVEMKRKTIIKSKNSKFLPSILNIKTLSNQSQTSKQSNSWDIFLTQTIGLKLMFKVQSDLPINKFFPQLLIEKSTIHHIILDIDSLEIFQNYHTSVSDIFSILYLSRKHKLNASTQQVQNFINQLTNSDLIKAFGLNYGLNQLVLTLFIQKHNNDISNNKKETILLQDVTRISDKDIYLYQNKYLQQNYNPQSIYNRNLIYIIEKSLDSNTSRTCFENLCNSNVYLFISDDIIGQCAVPSLQNQYQQTQTSVIVNELLTHFRYEEIYTHCSAIQTQLEQISYYQSISSCHAYIACFIQSFLFELQNYYQGQFNKILLKHVQFLNQILQLGQCDQQLQQQYASLLQQKLHFPHIISSFFSILELQSSDSQIVKYPSNNSIPFKFNNYYKRDYRLITNEQLQILQVQQSVKNKIYLSSFSSNIFQIQKLLFFLEFNQNIQVEQNEIFLLDIVQDVSNITNSKFYVYQKQDFVDFYLGICLKILQLQQRCIILIQSQEMHEIKEFLQEILLFGYSATLINQCSFEQEIVFIEQVKHATRIFQSDFTSILDVLQYHFFKNNSILDLLHFIVESENITNDNLLINLHLEEQEENILADLYQTSSSRKLEEISQYHLSTLSHLKLVFEQKEEEYQSFINIQQFVSQKISDYEAKYKKTLPNYQDQQSLEELQIKIDLIQEKLSNYDSQSQQVFGIQQSLEANINDKKELIDSLLNQITVAQQQLKSYRINLRQVNHFEFHIYNQVSKNVLKMIFLIIYKDKKYDNFDKIMRRKIENLDKLVREIAEQSITIQQEFISLIFGLFDISCKDVLLDQQCNKTDKIQKLEFISQIDEYLFNICLTFLFINLKRTEKQNLEKLLDPLLFQVKQQQVLYQNLCKKQQKCQNESNQQQIQIEFIKNNSQRLVEQNEEFHQKLTEMKNIQDLIKVVTPDVYFQQQNNQILSKNIDYNANICAFLLYQQQYFLPIQQSILERYYGVAIGISDQFLPYVLTNYFTKQQLITIFKMCSKYKLLNRKIKISKNDTQITQEKIIFLIQKHQNDVTFCDQLFNLFNQQLNMLEEVLFENLINFLDEEIVLLILKQVYLNRSCILQTDNKQIAELIGSFMQYSEIMPYNFYSQINICTTVNDIQNLNYQNSNYLENQNNVILVYNIDYSIVKPLVHGRCFQNIYRFNYKTGSLQDNESYTEIQSSVNIKILYVQQQDIQDQFVNTYQFKQKKRQSKSIDQTSYQIHSATSQTSQKFGLTIDQYLSLLNNQKMLISLINSQQILQKEEQIEIVHVKFMNDLYKTIINLIEYKKYLVGNIE